MIKKAIVFIDAFAYNYLPYARFMQTFTHKARLIPGLGYSVNVKAELFAGLQPKDVGYFCMWAYSPNSKFKKWHPFLKLLKPCSLNYIVDRASHKILSKVFKTDLFNIPFEYLYLFDSFSGVSAYDGRFKYPCLVNNRPGLAKALHTFFPYSSIRDKQVFEMACHLIESGEHSSIFIAFSDLDGITHRHGTGSGKVKDKVVELDGYLEAIQDRHPPPDSPGKGGRVCAGRLLCLFC